MKNKKLFTSIFLMIIIAAIFFIKYDNDYIVKIDNEKVSPAEFEVYLNEQKKMFEAKGGEDIWEADFDGIEANEVAKQNAINSIVFVKTAAKEAGKLGIKIEESDNIKIKDMKEKFYKNAGIYKHKLTKKQVDKMVKQWYIQQKVYDYITKGFEISDIDYYAYVNEYYENNKKELNEVKIKYIFIKAEDEYNDLKRAEEIYAKVSSSMDFEAAQKKYSQIKEFNAVSVEEGKFEAEVEEEAYNLLEGEISAVIATKSGFYIIKAVEVKIPDYEQLKEDLKEDYVISKKQEIYQNQIDKWSEDVTIIKKEKLWKEINV